jgi:single-strand DNA-binding protein
MYKTSCAKVKIVKVLPPTKGEKGVKAMIQLPGEMDAFLRVAYDGPLTEKVRESVGKCLVLLGTFRFKKNVPLPIFEATGELDTRLVFVGRLTKEAELKYSQQGKCYTSFSIAVNYGWGDRKETDFINCTIFGNEKEHNAAVVLAEQGQKGRQIIVTGRLGQNKKDDKIYTNLIVDDFQFVGPFEKKGEPQEKPYDDWASFGNEIDMSDF